MLTKNQILQCIEAYEKLLDFLNSKIDIPHHVIRDGNILRNGVIKVGLCSLLQDLYGHSHPSIFYIQADLDCDSEDYPYLFPVGLVEPRIKWLEENIEILKSEL
jgi:hypothetical protein